MEGMECWLALYAFSHLEALCRLHGSHPLLDVDRDVSSKRDGNPVHEVLHTTQLAHPVVF